MRFCSVGDYEKTWWVFSIECFELHNEYWKFKIMFTENSQKFMTVGLSDLAEMILKLRKLSENCSLTQNEI